jgi:IS30 family transposase
MQENSNYLRICFEERVKISLLREIGHSIGAIARSLRRSKSSISRELKRECFPRSSYGPGEAEFHAQVYAHHRRKGRGKLATNPKLLKEVLLGLRKRWSPEQISRSLRLRFPEDKSMQVSHETIYTYVYVLPRGELRQELFRCLRQKKKTRSRRKNISVRRGNIREMISIEERPKEVLDRSLAGHWEGDLIIGKNHGTALGTLVERKTRAVILVPLKDKSAWGVRKAFENAMRNLPKRMRQTLTYDQGSEMAEHRLFTKNTKIKVYFCHPASPWERGTCENTNGLLRDYFPKGTDFAEVSSREIKRVENQLNERPRKTLGYLTPKEVFANEVLNAVPLES